MYSMYIFIYIYIYVYINYFVYNSVQITCISWTLSESVTCFLVFHCCISSVCCYHGASSHNLCDNRNACSQICSVFVYAVRRHLEIDVGRIKRTEEGEGYCMFKNNEELDEFHQMKYMEMSLRETLWRPSVFSCRTVTVSTRCWKLTYCLNGISATREPH